VKDINDILNEKLDALHKQQLERARADPQLAHELYVTGLFPEVERFYYPDNPVTLKRDSQN